MEIFQLHSPTKDNTNNLNNNNISISFSNLKGLNIQTYNLTARTKLLLRPVDQKNSRGKIQQKIHLFIFYIIIFTKIVSQVHTIQPRFE